MSNTNCLGCGTYLTTAWRHDYGDFCLACSRKNAEKGGRTMGIPKGTKLSPEHRKAISEGRKRAAAARRRKGKWSPEARKRAKERFAAKREAALLNGKVEALTVSQRLEIIEQQAKRIREQLAALKSL